jgi:hypothetical protein
MSLDKLVIAARYPTESVDLYVQETEHMSPRDPNLEERIVSHLLMQQELARQQRDLAVLRSKRVGAVQEVRKAAAQEWALELE